MTGGRARTPNLGRISRWLAIRAVKPFPLLGIISAYGFRCYAEKKDGKWQAFCVDLCLAAQADTLDEVRKKLDAMVDEYVKDALFGEDKDYAEALLKRKAPLRERLKYQLFAMFNVFGLRRAVWVIEK